MCLIINETTPTACITDQWEECTLSSCLGGIEISVHYRQKNLGPCPNQSSNRRREIYSAAIAHPPLKPSPPLAGKGDASRREKHVYHIGTEALKGHRKKKKVVRIAIPFPRNNISFERNVISRERNSNFHYFFFSQCPFRASVHRRVAANTWWRDIPRMWCMAGRNQIPSAPIIINSAW